MIINTLSTVAAKIKISSITVPSFSEMASMKTNVRFKGINITTNEDWWLRPDIFYPDTQPYVGAGTVEQRWGEKNDIKGVRPVIRFTSRTFSVGDEFIFNNYLFAVVTPTVALCKTVVGYTTPDKIFAVSDEWADRTIDEYDKFQDVDKVIKVVPVDIGTASICHETKYYAALPPLALKTGYPYWTLSRKSEFSAWYIDEKGNLGTGDITAKHEVCPLFQIDIDKVAEDAKEILFPYSIFEFNNRLFRCTEKHRFICLNTLGKTCFTTGLAEMGNKKEEYDIVSHSEIYEPINRWLGINMKDI